ncbi:MAG TPA: CocE/NonD family hydrolase, partial [Methanotrichaceae archaeon]|nr:CocE/NonD family hydrolase [Methanotrichaceae archaeon]
MSNMTDARAALVVLIFFTLAGHALANDDEYENQGTPQSNAFNTERDWLTMPDGVNLSVTYLLPVTNEPEEKFPVLLEMDPYRKDDMSYLWDYPQASYFAKHGYAVALVDVRGTGASEGSVPVSEYSEEELSDGVEIIDQLSKKPWSNGNVGMYGYSWSGCNALLIADRKPPALKAILIAHLPDDLFYLDCHYIDGVFHTDTWEAMIDTYNALPSTEDYAINSNYFEDRFDQEPWHFVWKRNQADGPFWRNESARFKPDVETPVYVIGGLLDSYRDMVPRLLNSSSTLVKAEIGPWGHDWPSSGTPSPNYEWREKGVRWWDYWLKGIDNGIMAEPRFMIFVRDGNEPSTAIKTLPGEWRSGSWPIGGIEAQKMYPGPSQNLQDSAPDRAAGHALAYHAGAGSSVPGWWGDLTDDMSSDDAYSLVYDSEPLTEPIEIIGFPEIYLNVSADAPLYQWTVRLEDLSPDGNVSLVSGVLINPADRISRLERTPLTPGEPAKLSGEIHYTTWRFKPGHKIRLAVSNAQFPMAWPTPYRGNTTLFTGQDTFLELPVVKENTLTGTCDVPAPEPDEYPSDATTAPKEVSYPAGNYNPETGDSSYLCGEEYAWTIRNTSYNYTENNAWRVNDKDPAHATYETETNYKIALPDRVIDLIGIFSLASDEKSFNLTVTRRLLENDIV